MDNQSRDTRGHHYELGSDEAINYKSEFKDKF